MTDGSNNFVLTYTPTGIFASSPTPNTPYDTSGNSGLVLGLGTANADPANTPTSPTNLQGGTYNGILTIGGGQIQSANFVTGVSGWQILANGNVEFNNGTFRGTLSASAIVNTPNSILITAGQTIIMGDAVFSSDGTMLGPIILSDNGGVTSQNFGRTTGARVVAERFTAPGNDTITKIKLIVKNIVSPVDSITVGIQGDSGGNPSGSYISSDNLAASSMTGNFAEYTFTVSAPLTSGLTYYVVVQRTGSLDDTNLYNIASFSNSAAHKPVVVGGLVKTFDGSTWTNDTSVDLAVKVFIGAIPSGQIGRASSFTGGNFNTFIGIAKANIASGTAGYIDVGGFSSILSGLSAGSQYYLSNGIGTLSSSSTEPTNQRKVGISTGSSSMVLTNIW